MQPNTNRPIFVNIPVSDLKKSIAFFTELGFTFNQQFTDETATSMIVSDKGYFMLLTKERFQEFTKRPVADARTQTEAIFALGVDSRAEVDEMVHTALANGGSASNDPQDHGFMYAWSFQDPDGHLWEVFHMDPSYVQPQ